MFKSFHLTSKTMLSKHKSHVPTILTEPKALAMEGWTKAPASGSPTFITVWLFSSLAWQDRPPDSFLSNSSHSRLPLIPRLGEPLLCGPTVLSTSLSLVLIWLRMTHSMCPTASYKDIGTISILLSTMVSGPSSTLACGRGSIVVEMKIKLKWS